MPNAKSPTLRDKMRKGAAVQIPSDLAKEMQNIGAQVGLSGAKLTRIGLAYLLPKITAGEFEVVNGQLRPSGQREAQAA